MDISNCCCVCKLQSRWCICLHLGYGDVHFQVCISYWSSSGSCSPGEGLDLSLFSIITINLTTTTSSTIMLTRRRTRKMFKFVSVLESTLSSMSVPVPRGNLPTMIEIGYTVSDCVWGGHIEHQCILLPPIVSLFTSLVFQSIFVPPDFP